LLLDKTVSLIKLRETKKVELNFTLYESLTKIMNEYICNLMFIGPCMIVIVEE